MIRPNVGTCPVLQTAISADLMFSTGALFLSVLHVGLVFVVMCGIFFFFLFVLLRRTFYNKKKQKENAVVGKLMTIKTCYAILSYKI